MSNIYNTCLWIYLSMFMDSVFQRYDSCAGTYNKAEIKN